MKSVKLLNHFNSYVDELRDHLIDEAGNKNGKVSEEDYHPMANECLKERRTKM
jgi:hypothetical protein